MWHEAVAAAAPETEWPTPIDGCIGDRMLLMMLLRLGVGSYKQSRGPGISMPHSEHVTPTPFDAPANAKPV